MVLRLVANVISDLINLIITDCKCAIATLPFEKFAWFDFVGDSVRRAAFCFVN